MTSQLLSSVSGVRVNHLRSSFLRFSQSFRLILSAQPIIILFSFVDLILLFVSFIFLLFSSLICYVCHLSLVPFVSKISEWHTATIVTAEINIL